MYNVFAKCICTVGHGQKVLSHCSRVFENKTIDQRSVLMYFIIFSFKIYGFRHKLMSGFQILAHSVWGADINVESIGSSSQGRDRKKLYM